MLKQSNHFKERALNLSPISRAVFAREPNGTLVVFVHGFASSATSAWTKFPTLLTRTPQFRGVDCVFYGYDGFWGEMIASASELYQFLNEVLHSPPDLFNSNRPKTVEPRRTFKYKRVLLVAHSLGAVICRKALLQARYHNKSWVNATELFLYAPAHKGARPQGIVRQLPLQKALAWFLSMGRYSMPLIDQLDMSSYDLVELENQTKEGVQNDGATATNAKHYLKATRVCIASHDRVVYNRVFAYDPPGDSIPSTNHSSVCKPTSVHSAQLQMLLQVL